MEIKQGEINLDTFYFQIVLESSMHGSNQNKQGLLC